MAAERTQTTLRWLRASICLGLLAAFLIAPRLWFHHRFFAPLPPLDWLPSIPAALDGFFYGGLILLLPAIALARRGRPVVLAWCGLFALRAAFDLTIWQPYFYQYDAMLLASCLPANRGRDEPALDANRLIVACVYFWSGLNKLNYAFLTAGLDAVPGLSDLLASLSPWIAPSSLARLTAPMPFIEVAIGVGLLLHRRARRLAAGAAIAMHALILLSIGPLGANHNPVVWPWNVAMIAFVALLFFQNENVPPRRIIWGRNTFHHVLLVLFAFGPLLSVFGLWPSSLSFRLYSFRFHTGEIYVTEALRERLPAETRAQLEPVSASFRLVTEAGGRSENVGPFAGGVNISDWSERELNAFVPPEPRVFTQVYAKVCALAQKPKDALLLLASPPELFTGAKRQQIFSCPGQP